MRIVIYSMLVLLIAIQFPLWLGKGGWLKVYEMEKQVELQEAKNSLLALRNAKLSGDVKDLKDGTRAIEERARRHAAYQPAELYAVPFQQEEKEPETK